ncbi:MAG TPA: alpha/beta fold hydrolase [Isosphaeraceae bacterium]|jgi:3-oxoadipate enol-lactonase|nr:alpha/beta fold hydrolase [Isosphaeraceae bacterium]
MRFAAKRQARWTSYRDVGAGARRQLLFGRGSVEVIRLGQGEPIVLVPGLAGGWKLLAPLARRLAQRHEVILYGLRGDRGPTATDRAETVADYASDLAALCDGLALERPAVFGVSFGAAVALELAVEQPNRIGSLIVQGVEARFRGGLGARIALQALERFPLPSDNRFLNQFFNLLHGGRPEPGPLTDFVVERCWETDQGVMARRLRALESFDVGDRLWRIDVPTLVLAGTRDAIVPPAGQHSLAASISGARLTTLDGAGHIAFLTHRADVARHVRSHFRAARRALR